MYISKALTKAETNTNTKQPLHLEKIKTKHRNNHCTRIGNV